MTYRKIGGLHWIFIGRFCIAFCIRKPKPKMPKAMTLEQVLEHAELLI